MIWRDAYLEALRGGEGVNSGISVNNVAFDKRETGL
jgi:hypothetical protein